MKCFRWLRPANPYLNSDNRPLEQDVSGDRVTNFGPARPERSGTVGVEVNIEDGMGPSSPTAQLRLKASRFVGHYLRRVDVDRATGTKTNV